MTTRQEYWMHLRIIHHETGEWNRSLSFTQAAEWVESYMHDRTTGYPTANAAQRAYDIILNPKRKEWALV